MGDNASAGVRTVEDMVRVPITELVTYIAIAAVQDPDWSARAAGVRPHLSENTLAAIREVAKRLNDYANAALTGGVAVPSNGVVGGEVES